MIFSRNRCFNLIKKLDVCRLNNKKRFLLIKSTPAQSENKANPARRTAGTHNNGGKQSIIIEARCISSSRIQLLSWIRYTLKARGAKKQMYLSILINEWLRHIFITISAFTKIRGHVYASRRADSEDELKDILSNDARTTNEQKRKNCVFADFVIWNAASGIFMCSK